MKRMADFRYETGLVHKLALNPSTDIFYEDHALKRMRKRKIDRLDVERVLRTGVVIEARVDKDGDERLTVEAKNLDGTSILNVVVFVWEENPMITVLTAFPK